MKVQAKNVVSLFLRRSNNDLIVGKTYTYKADPTILPYSKLHNGKKCIVKKKEGLSAVVEWPDRSTSTVAHWELKP